MKIRILSEDLAEKAKKELNEDSKTINEDLRILKEWLVKQPHLRARQDDQWLIGFIRGCKHSLEKAKLKLDLYYTVRTLIPEMSRIDLDDSDFRHILESGYCLPLQTLDVNGARIYISRPGTYDSSVYNVHDSTKVLCAVAEMMLMDDDDAVVSGITVVWDCAAVNLAFASQLTPTNIKKMIALMMDSMPIRTKSIHILNAPSFFETVLNFLKPMLSAKINNRVFIYGKNMSDFYKHVPKERLPIEYGGTFSNLEDIKRHMIYKLDQYHDWFAKYGDYGTDESRRPGQPTTSENFFGLAGSFKQLNVD